jgi:hypothetical protein
VGGSVAERWPIKGRAFYLLGKRGEGRGGGGGTEEHVCPAGDFHFLHYFEGALAEMGQGNVGKQLEMRWMATNGNNQTRNRPRHVEIEKIKKAMVDTGRSS